MRILHLLSQTELTGAEVYAQNLIEYQTRAQQDVFVISDKIHVQLPVAWTSLSVSTSSGFQRIRNIWKLRRFLTENKIEVIHCHSRGAVRHAFWARWGMPVTLVTSLHGRQHFSWSKRLMNLYGEIQIAICENVKKAFERDFKKPGSSIRVLRNPVAVKENDISTASPSSLHIGLLGRSSGPKGQRFEQIIQSCFETWLYHFAGLQISIIVPQPDKFSQKTLSHLQKLNEQFPGQVKLLGQIPDLKSRLKEFSLILASGRIAIEGIVAKVPVFALGEHSAPGLVQKNNFAECLSSNFGDIGALETEVPLDLKFVENSVGQFLKAETSRQDLSSLATIAEKEFAPERINRKILDIYRAAIFKRHVPQWIPILMYHKIPDQVLESQHRIFVTRENFQKHLQFFKARHLTTMTFSDLLEFWTGKKPFSHFPRKPLILTFDDGYIDNLTHAQPLLKAFQFQAVIYLLGNHQITENTWDTKTGEVSSALMTFEEKKKLDSSVWEIASHGFDHLHLTDVSREKAFQELQQSRLQLEKDFQRPVLSFAYPFGSTSPEIAELAEEAGYQFAVNTDQGGLHLADNPFSLFRVNIFPEDSLFQLWKKTSSWYRRYFYRKRNR